MTFLDAGFLGILRVKAAMYVSFDDNWSYGQSEMNQGLQLLWTDWEWW